MVNNMFEYDKFSKAAAEELDKYDFTEILSECYDNDLRSPWDIMERIVDEYAELGFIDGALDNLSNDEFMEYLTERYPIKFEEVITYRMWYK